MGKTWLKQAMTIGFWLSWTGVFTIWNIVLVFTGSLPILSLVCAVVMIALLAFWIKQAVELFRDAEKYGVGTKSEHELEFLDTKLARWLDDLQAGR